MPVQSHKITRQDCGLIIDRLISILNEVGLGQEQEVGFVVYGSYCEKWREGLSDLDGMLYFSGLPPLHLALRPKIKAFQAKIAGLYEEFPFLKSGHYLSDVFILDSLHASDGRFMIFDCDFMYEFWHYTSYQFFQDTKFVGSFNPVRLRNQHEFELATGLHKLRNYLFFEIPRLPQEMSLPYATEVLKSFRVLPRVATRLAGKHMAKSLADLEHCFEGINYLSLRDLWIEAANYDSQNRYLRAWHEPESTAFIDCLECFELTLAELIRNYPMKSVH